MEAKLWVVIDTASKSSSAQAERTVETGFTFTPGMMVEDIAWEDARQVSDVYFSTDTPDVLSVYMGRDVAQNESHFRLLVDGYRGHGWKVRVSGEDRD